MFHWRPPWLVHGKRAPLRALPGAKQARPGIEVLEDRLALSSSTMGPLPANPVDWRSDTFSIENLSVAKPPGGAAFGLLQNSTATQGEGFAQDIGLDKVVAQYPSYTGAGYTVAIIDTGIDYNNPALGGGWGKRVIAGYNFVSNTSDPMDDNGHGSHVAGIIGSSNATYTGIAPDVRFVALKVLDASGSGTFGNVDLALQWVAAHQAQYHIVAVNLSLGSGNYTANPYAYLDADFTALKSKGVFVACASGNSFYSVGSQQGLAYPAISPQVVSVGAVWDGNFGAVSWMSGARDNVTAVDSIASFTQRSAALDILAPGAMITSTYLNNTFQQMAGTSMATPVIAGASVLIHEALDLRNESSLANQDYILNLMQTTGTTIVDKETAADNVVNTGLGFKRLDLFAALNKVGPSNYTSPTLAAIATQTMTAGVPLVVALSAGASSGGTLTFHAQATITGDSAAYQLGQQLGLSYAGSYFLNSMGQNEKWVLGASNQWYCLMPDGDLRHWTGAAAGTLAPAALVASLSPVVYNDPPRLWTAPVATAAPATFSFAGNQLTIQCEPNFLGNFTVVVSATDGITSVNQSFTVNVTHRAPVLGAIANQTIAHSRTALTVNLAISNPDNDALILSAQILPPVQNVGLAFAGNQLTITPASSVLGAFSIQVTLGDGLLSFKQTFNVTVTDSAPILGAVPAQTLGHGKTLMVPLAANDPDGDVLTWSAQTVTPSQQALNLEQTLNLTYTGNYWTNYYGKNEKWLKSGTTGAWYCLMPDGALRLAGTSVSNMLAAGSLVATLDGNYCLDPSLLWNARNYTAPQVVYALSANQLSITPPSGFTGTFIVRETASDGAIIVPQNFPVTVGNAAPVLTSIANQKMSHSQGSLTIPLAATDADGDALTYSAQVLSNSQIAYSLKQSLGLTFTGNYWPNYDGAQEKWILGTVGTATAATQWYCILPNGELRHGGNSAAQMLSAASLVATLDSSCYQDPSLLWNAKAGTPLAVVAGVTGSQLTIQPPANFIGTFAVQVTVSDGITTATKSFSVTVTDNAPSLGSLASQNQDQGLLLFNLNAADVDGDFVTLSAKALPYSPTAVQPRVTLVIRGNQLTVTPVAGYKGTFYVEVTASDGFTSTTKDYLMTI